MDKYIHDFLEDIPDYLKNIAIDFISTETTMVDLGKKYGFSRHVMGSYITRIYDHMGVEGGRPALQAYFIEYLTEKIEKLESDNNV